MPACPKCGKSFKTAQGLNGHTRFRHQVTIPKESLPAYAQERLQKAEAENARLREQLARKERQRQDLENFYEKRNEEQKIKLEGAQERKVSQHEAAVSKQAEEQNRLHQAQIEKITALVKEVEEQHKRLEGLLTQQAKPNEVAKRPEPVDEQREKSLAAEEWKSEVEKLRRELAQNSNRSRRPSLLPPLPHPPPRPDPLRPLSSIRELGKWLRHE